MTLDLTFSPVTQKTDTRISYEAFVQHYAGQHAEWVDGEVILPMNNEAHQNLLTLLIQLLGLYLGIRPLGKVYPAGYQMYLGPGLPAREPDLMIVLNEHLDRIQQNRLEGPADIAIEIVSPESIERDYGTKFAEYEQAKVQEYWIIDPLRHLADVYHLSESQLYERVSADAQGRLRSPLLAGFALEIDLLWRKPLPQGWEVIELVQQLTQPDSPTS